MMADSKMIDGNLKLGFEMQGITLSLDDILPSRKTDDKMKAGRKYAIILASIHEIGIIEPPIVHSLKTGTNTKYLLLDGHMRIEALKELGIKTVHCIISTDDESYTYNNKVNQMHPIQEYFMILRAIEQSVSEQRIASALKVEVSKIREKQNLLNGICPEAVDILKDTSVGAKTICKLKKVKPMRQVEIAEMMHIMNNYSGIYCEALITATPKSQMVEGAKTKNSVNLNSEDMARMQREMETLQRDLQNYEDSYRQNFINLVVVRGYLSRLLDNGWVVRFLSSNHPDILTAFQQVVESTSLDG